MLLIHAIRALRAGPQARRLDLFSLEMGRAFSGRGKYRGGDFILCTPAAQPGVD